MDGIQIDGALFCAAETAVEDSITALQNVIDSVSSLKIPEDFDSGMLFSIKDNLQSILNDLKQCMDVINRTKHAIYNSSMAAEFIVKYKSYLNSLNLLNNMSDNEKLALKDYLMKYLQSGAELDENTKNLLLAVLGENYSKINYSGEFANFTDLQKIYMAYFSNVFNDLETDKDFVEGKTIRELLNSDKYRNDERLMKLFECGFGDIRITEVKRGSNGFSALVLQDKSGNYMLHYNCTETEGETSNIVGDAGHDGALAASSVTMSIIAAVIPPKDLEKYGTVLKVMSCLGLGDAFATTVVGAAVYGKFCLESQRRQARELSEKYINIARSENVKVHLSGYSLGGSLTEESLLYFDKHGKDVLGNVTVYNPIHNNLSKEEVKIIKSYGDQYQCYIAQGDLVSAVSNYDDFKDSARYIGNDYVKTYEDIIESYDGFDVLYKLFVGPPHSASTILDENEAAIKNNFDENGNYNSNAKGVSIQEAFAIIEDLKSKKNKNN